MFVRRLLVSAILAGLAACSSMNTYQVDKNPNFNKHTKIGGAEALNYKLLPQRTSPPASKTQSFSNANDTALCLKQRLSSEFKLPEEFIAHKVYTDNNHSVGLINPFTKTEGITMDVVNQAGGSEIRLYENGNLLSRAWKQLPSKCGSGKSIATNSSKPVVNKPNNKVDFVSASKPSTAIAPIVVASTAPIAVKTTPTVTAPVTRLPATPLLLANKTEAPVTNSTTLATSQPTPNNWEHGELTPDDMNILAPATASLMSMSTSKPVATQTKASTTPTSATTNKRPESKTTKATTEKATTKPVANKTSTTKASTDTAKSKTTSKTDKTNSKDKNSKAKTVDSKESSKNSKTSKAAANSKDKQTKTEVANNKNKTDKNQKAANKESAKKPAERSKVAVKDNKPASKTSKETKPASKNTKTATKEDSSKTKTNNAKTTDKKAADKKVEKKKPDTKNTKAKS